MTILATVMKISALSLQTIDKNIPVFEYLTKFLLIKMYTHHLVTKKTTKIKLGTKTYF